MMTSQPSQPITLRQLVGRAFQAFAHPVKVMMITDCSCFPFVTSNKSSNEKQNGAE